LYKSSDRKLPSLLNFPEEHLPQHPKKFYFAALFFSAAEATCSRFVVKMIRKSRRFFRLASPSLPSSNADVINVNAHSIPIIYRRHARARNYVLRLHANQTVVVTLPRAGTTSFARDFVASRKSWLEKQWRILETRKIPPHFLRPGMEILFRGAPVTLRIQKEDADWQLQFGAETTRLPSLDGNLRPILERHLQNLAKTELVIRAHELARAHHLDVKRVTVRNQKSRWGSCSHNGTISLNWRLVQLPADVRDYIIIHELMHLRQLNHSPRFWAEVEKVCPDYRTAEEWLKKNSGQVGF
jgi:predicted metal-dependent hydrolase